MFLSPEGDNVSCAITLFIMENIEENNRRRQAHIFSVIYPSLFSVTSFGKRSCGTEVIVENLSFPGQRTDDNGS